jgi:thiol-disulfide isomerase/thioredoxin
MSRSLLLASLAGVALIIGASALPAAQSGSKPSGTARPAQSAEAVKPAAAPSLIALSFYADWCPGCKELAPKLDAVVAAAAKQPCLFVKLDQTDRESRQAEFLLASLGMGELWKEHAGKTGYALLVDPATKRVVGRISADQDTEAMKSSVSKALGARL